MQISNKQWIHNQNVGIQQVLYNRIITMEKKKNTIQVWDIIQIKPHKDVVRHTGGKASLQYLQKARWRFKDTDLEGTVVVVSANESLCV